MVVGDPITVDTPLVGVLAVQGGFEAHRHALTHAGARAREVRTPEEMDGLDGLVLPGGESTTVRKGIEQYGLADSILAMHTAGRPLFGTCAGLIVLSSWYLDLIDVDVRRNAFGRQISSFEADLTVDGIGTEPFRGIFIRAPWIERIGSGVQELSVLDGHPVAVRQGNTLVTSFHPELGDDMRLHTLFLAVIDSLPNTADSNTAVGAENLR